MFTDNELTALANEFLAEPFGKMAALFSEALRTGERNGLDN